jgi:hypothetical protein
VAERARSLWVAVAGSAQLRTHTGQPVAQAGSAWLDEDGALLVECLGSVGLVHDRDLEGLLPYLREAGGGELDEARFDRWLGGSALEVRLHLDAAVLAVGRIGRGQVPARFGFDPQPRPRPGEPEC